MKVTPIEHSKQKHPPHSNALDCTTSPTSSTIFQILSRNGQKKATILYSLTIAGAFIGLCSPSTAQDNIPAQAQPKAVQTQKNTPSNNKAENASKELSKSSTNNNETTEKQKTREELFKETQERISILIAGLSDNDYDTREDASKELWKIGQPALEQLKKATQSPDPEIATRATALQLYISAGVLFDSSDDIKQLVLSYQNASAAEKLIILNKLTKLDQLKQVLHLAKLEKNPAVKKKISKLVYDTASKATQNALVKGQYDKAEKYLELASDSPTSKLMYAWFLCQRGKLQEELNKANSMSLEDAQEWKSILYRASGDIENAIKYAELSKHTKLTSALKIFSGDPIPWLSLQLENSSDSPIINIGQKIQLARLQGNQKLADSLSDKLYVIADNKYATLTEIEFVITGLASNGYKQKSLDLLKTTDPISAFDYYNITESPHKALEAFDIPKDAKPPYTKWVQSFTKHAVDLGEEPLYNRLIILAQFLGNHGEGQHAEAVLTPLMTALKDGGFDYWFEIIKMMSYSDLAPQAIHFLEKRGNDDGEADEGIAKILDDTKEISSLWRAIKKRHNNDLKKSLHDIGLLAGLLPDPNHETEALSQSYLDEVAKKSDKQKNLRRVALFRMATKRHELPKALEMAESFVKDDKRWQTKITMLYNALLMWDKLEPIYRKAAKKVPGNYYNLVQWSICLEHLGRKKEAREKLNKALLLSMGKPSVLNQFAIQYYVAGLKQQGRKLVRFAALMSEPGSPNFNQSIDFLANTPQIHPTFNKWKQIAAFSEVLANSNLKKRLSYQTLRLFNIRFRADFFRGMALLQEGKRQEAIQIMNLSQHLMLGSGSVSDDFFPSLVGKGVDEEYQKWFDAAYHHVNESCKLYPKSANSHNSAAWLCAKAQLKLDEGLKHAQIATTLRPELSAYLDTLAEIWFAKGDRKKAIQISEKSVEISYSHPQGHPRKESMVIQNYKSIVQQLHHFKNDPLPKLNLSSQPR